MYEIADRQCCEKNFCIMLPHESRDDFFHVVGCVAVEVILNEHPLDTPCSQSFKVHVMTDEL